MLTGRAGLGVALDNRIGNRLNRQRQILPRVELGGGPRDVVKALLHRVEEEPHEVAEHNQALSDQQDTLGNGGDEIQNKWTGTSRGVFL